MHCGRRATCIQALQGGRTGVCHTRRAARLLLLLLLLFLSLSSCRGVSVWMVCVSACGAQAAILHHNNAIPMGYQHNHTGLRHEVLQGLCGVYTNVVQPSASSRHAFLSALLRPLDRAADLHSSDAVLTADLHQLRFVVQLLFALPFKRGDEGMRVLEPAHAMLWTRGEATLDALRTALEAAGGVVRGDGEQAAPSLPVKVREGRGMGASTK